MQYIATRPRVQKYGSHGLFSSATAVDLASAMSELEAHEGNVWTIIYSLRREDAARLEFDNADAWRTLLMENAPTLAKSMKISLNNFHWLRKPPAMPVEVSRKKALASSIERSESRITIQRIRMHSIKTADARLRAAEHLMQVKNHSVHL